MVKVPFEAVEEVLSEGKVEVAPIRGDVVPIETMSGEAFS